MYRLERLAVELGPLPLPNLLHHIPRRRSKRHMPRMPSRHSNTRMQHPDHPPPSIDHERALGPFGSERPGLEIVGIDSERGGLHAVRGTEISLPCVPPHGEVSGAPVLGDDEARLMRVDGVGGGEERGRERGGDPQLELRGELKGWRGQRGVVLGWPRTGACVPTLDVNPNLGRPIDMLDAPPPKIAPMLAQRAIDPLERADVLLRVSELGVLAPQDFCGAGAAGS
ncbi:hypothetical protein H0H92_007980 [Tricholoma furcatifolium]|nr:hypothetical protein H0H92_007980 [Tricholoma furcatifolium]